MIGVNLRLPRRTGVAARSKRSIVLGLARFRLRAQSTNFLNTALQRRGRRRIPRFILRDSGGHLLSAYTRAIRSRWRWWYSRA